MIMKTASVLAAICAGSVLLTEAFAGDVADMIYHNGNIITISDDKPRVEAVAVKDGKILIIGDKEGVFEAKGDVTKLIDL